MSGHWKDILTKKNALILSAALIALAISVPDPAFTAKNRASKPSAKTISSAKGTISESPNFMFHLLREIPAGETLYVYAETTAGDLIPVITLLDHKNKPVKTTDAYGEEFKAAMEYTLPRTAKTYRLRISGRPSNGQVTTGKYRLLAGINAPKILEGSGTDTDRSILEEPVRVKVGTIMHQITEVNQKNENYGVVATIYMEWKDPTLVFDPEAAGERVRLYSGDGISRAMNEQGVIWPDFNIYNQQGNRWAQNKILVIFPDGNALYLERFTTTLQAPDFDFRRFPFDEQQFFIRIDSLFPEWNVMFEPMEGYSKVGEQLGEEEWLVTSFDVSISEAEIANRPVSRFNFRFEARRHLEYYILRILLPIFIILLVSWVVFFLKDYGKRLDVAGGNLLVFIAFNFTISNDLPRLGYLTLMDAILTSAFLATALVLILSVFLKRTAEAGREEFVQKIDRYVVRWLYPVLYAGAVAAVYLLFS